VHALGQVASVNLESDSVRRRSCGAQRAAAVGHSRARRSRTPARVSTRDFDRRGKIVPVSHVDRAVLSPFDRFYVWHAPEPKRLDWMQQAAAALVGRHDFLSFQARGAFVRETVRTLDRLQVTQAGDELILDCTGDGFLRHMVRIIAGTLAEVGTGLRPVTSMPDVLEARDRRVAGATAPAQGLTLVSVRYSL
jgi:tRNA pseudouridine38-40 synthase